MSHEAQHAPTVAVLERHVRARVEALQMALLQDDHHAHSATVARLARLRRVDADRPGDPAAWEVAFADLPTELLGRSDEPSRAERAAHAALVLFAAHIQSADGRRHDNGRRLGLAVGALARSAVVAQEDYATTAVARRFRAFATATTWAQALGHLRGLISQLRAHDIAMDYGSLAADLYRMQTREGLRRARLQWGRDFHYLTTDDSHAEEN